LRFSQGGLVWGCVRAACTGGGISPSSGENLRDAEFPVYQNFTGNQLAAPVLFKVSLSYMF